MELLIGTLVSLVVLAVRKVTQRYGKELGSTIVLVVVFICSIAAAIGYAGLQANPEMLMLVTQIFSTSVAFYEVIMKRVILPAIKS